MLLRWLSRGRRSRQKGFTLIELLIVVCMIVALAAAIVPQMISFSAKPRTIDRVTEFAALQKSIVNMIANKGATQVDPHTGAGKTANNNWTTMPTGGSSVPLYSTYFERATSTHFYCWDKFGTITYQQALQDVCTSDN